MRTPLPEIVTLGCRLNTSESDVIRRHATDAGLNETVIVNTCAVTGEAVRQAAQAIRKARREYPEARLIVTGCAAQLAPARFAALPEVDHVLGNTEKMAAVTYEMLAKGQAPRVQVADIADVRTATLAPPRLASPAARARAFVEVQNGCDHRCTFCIIPFARGPSRSVPGDEVVARIRHVVETGTQEVAITGVDLTSYGGDLPERTGLGLLVRRILKDIPELPRLRISSIDSVEADPDLIAAFAEESRLMPHLHLSLQAGDDLILKRMKRRHVRADAIRFCDDMRRLRPDIVFGADLIAGFPTETEEMFENSLRLVDDCRLTFLHVFPYSQRQGTPAVRMPQVPGIEIKTRAQRLRLEADRVLGDYLATQIGQVSDVLMETSSRGRTPQFAEVDVVDGTTSVPGSLARVRIKGIAGRRLVGDVLA